tara:strand:- start:3901 stop:4524 length:624 start_codon:yes stop_codon:yes gene_type:complete
MLTPTHCLLTGPLHYQQQKTKVTAPITPVALSHSYQQIDAFVEQYNNTNPGEYFHYNNTTMLTYPTTHLKQIGAGRKRFINTDDIKMMEHRSVYNHADISSHHRNSTLSLLGLKRPGPLFVSSTPLPPEPKHFYLVLLRLSIAQQIDWAHNHTNPLHELTSLTKDRRLHSIYYISQTLSGQWEKCKVYPTNGFRQNIETLETPFDLS